MLRDRALMLRIVAASVALAINWTSYVWCVTHGRVIETALGQFLSPIGLVIANVVVYHEHLRTAPRVPLATLGWLQYSVPTINLALGVLVDNEAMPAWRIAGFGLVWIGLALITVDAVRNRGAVVEPA